MKSIIKLIFIILFFFLFTSFVTCIPGTVFLTNGYESYVVVHTTFLKLHDDTIIEMSVIQDPGSTDGGLYNRNSKLIAMRIETMEEGSSLLLCFVVKILLNHSCA